MNAIAVTKSRAQNRLEGFALTAIFQALPTYSAAALLLKLAGHPIPGGPVLFVVLTTMLHTLVTPWLTPNFPKFFRYGYEPLFFDSGLSFAEKLAQWRVQPTTSLQLVTSVLLLSLLAVAAVR